MSTEQADTTEAIVQIVVEAARVVVQAMSMASADTNLWAQNVGPIVGRPIMKQLTFSWSSSDK